METYRYDEAPGVAYHYGDTTAAMQILQDKALAVSRRPSHGKALNTLLRAFFHLNRSGVAAGWWL